MKSSYSAIKSEAVLEDMHSSAQGLSSQEALARLQKYGPNELSQEKKASIWLMFLSQFNDVLIILLIIAGTLSFFTGEYLEAIAIYAMLLLNAFLGLYQEYRAERAMDALKKISAPNAKVYRNNVQITIPAKDVVPGDIIFLEAGDIVPADARLFEVQSLKVDESALTGESVASEKNLQLCREGISIADQKNMVFSGTVVTYGKAKAIVVGTADNTEFGKIATVIKEIKEDRTPLQKKFEFMARQISVVVMVLVGIVFIAGLFDGISIKLMILFCLTLIVSTVPDSLPVVVTIGLSLGASRLAKKNMLVKKLSVAESLGSATVICTDKTGTLTKNQMTITNVYVGGKNISVTGAGYETKGEFSCDGKSYPSKNKDLQFLLRIGALCNDSKLSLNEDGHNCIIGDPTEGSILVLARKAGMNENDLQKQYPQAYELPFDSDRKCMSVLVKDKSKFFAYAKGAPDLLLHKCDRIYENGKIRRLTPKDKTRILAANEEFAKNALRVLCIAYRDMPANISKKLNLKKNMPDGFTVDEIEHDLIYVGLVGMIDPAREEVPNAILKCHQAGIKVIMITGDHAITARAIAAKIGLWSDRSIILTGVELDKMSDLELQAKIEDVIIVARALPIQKVRIIDALKLHGHVVAMTGDGVNDAPALKRADIGIAMGSGTDVAKEVAKGTLVDDNFSSIVSAIEEGRNVYDKILKSARYLLACNAGEIVAVFIALMMAFPLPILPLQLLLMNILTDDFPALGLGTEPSDDGVMQRPPRRPDERPIDGQVLFTIVFFGIIMGLATMYVFMKYKDADLPRAQTMAFTTLVMIEMFAVLSSRSLYSSWKKLNPFTNWSLLVAVVLSVIIQVAVIYVPILQRAFDTVALTGANWLLIFEVSLYGFIGMEAIKAMLWFMHNRKYKKLVVTKPNSM